MIGIVIVSHSRKLSDGLRDVADAMGQAPIPIASAGGVDDPDAPLGTDAVVVLGAIREVMSDGGVLVFADIGSAKLNAEMAMDLLDEAERQKVQFCDAPLVEGVLAATVQIAAGGDIQAVMNEARHACLQPVADERLPDLDGVSREFTIRNRLGLHARPAALFVKAMSGFAGDIRIANLTKEKPAANAKSINGVMLSEVSCHDRVRITAEPAEADAVFAKMNRLLRDGFGETDAASSQAVVAPEQEDTAPSEVIEGDLEGVCVTSGFAIGPIHHVQSSLPEIVPEQIDDVPAEIDRFETALAHAEAAINASLDHAGDRISAYNQKIFDAHIQYLHDPDIRDRVCKRIAAERICADAIWQQTISDLYQTYAALEDPVLKARADDITDVGLRVLAFLTGSKTPTHSQNGPVILAVPTLRPSDVLAFDQGQVLGICTTSGGKTSHAGILASALPIPVVFALGDTLAKVPEGQQVLLDGAAATLTISPTANVVAKMKADQTAWEDHRSQAVAVKFAPARTVDGKTVRVAANMASVTELGLVTNSGAEEVGLLRTEFMFMRRDTPPSEDEQFEIYCTMVKGLKGRTLTIRTIDIGGDKPVPYMDRPAEANPNLGWRGVRYSLDVPELFDTQLAAILRASAFGPVRIMFPLVSTLDEIKAAMERVRTVKERLDQTGQTFDKAIEIGIMIEVPAAAEMAHILAPEVDFFSIGTNDLTQYVMAADRANAKVQTLFDSFHPAVLRMVSKSIKAAHDADIWIGMCGAMAGSPMAAPVLIGMGLDEFSMTPSDIPEFKLAVKDLAVSDCRDLAGAVVKLPSASAVHEKISEFLNTHRQVTAGCNSIGSKNSGQVP